MKVWKYERWRYVGINKEVRALDTRVHENKGFARRPPDILEGLYAADSASGWGVAAVHETMGIAVSQGGRRSS